MPSQKNRNKLAPATQAPAVADLIGRVSGTALAQLLTDPQRTFTAVVVSFIAGDALRIDAQQLAEDLGTDVKVFEIANGIETRHLQSGLPRDVHIFGNGARVYPHGPEWSKRLPPPHVPRHASQLPALRRHLEREVAAARQLDPPAGPATASLPVSATAVVQGFPASDRAVVELAPGGEQALIRGEDLLPGVPLEWLLSKGQSVAGTLDPANHVLNIKALLQPHPSPVTVYRAGNVALARVKSLCPGHAMVELWPGSDFRIGVERISSNDLDSAEDLLTEGEVVRVRVLYENGAVRLSMLDVDDDEAAVPAPPLVRGGPPWLAPDRPFVSVFTPAADEPTPSPADGEGGPSGVDAVAAETLLSTAQRRTALQSTQMELETARRKIEELLAASRRQGATDKIAQAWQEQLTEERRVTNKLSRLHQGAEHQIESLRDELAKTKSLLVKLKQQRRSATSRTEVAPETLFLDPGEQFNFDVLLAWAHGVPATEKDAHPLTPFSTSSSFLTSWAALTPQQRAKVLRAVVDLVAERKGALRKREPHPLRLNEGAHSPPTLRGNDVCMRLYVEQGTSGALRLHYWKLHEGGVELHEVVPHDVVKP